MVNTIPINDERPHRRAPDCWCDPRVEWADEQGQIYPNGPMVIHNSADCREEVERLLGAGVGPEKKWAVYED
jgi:hypothetical protein